MKSLWEILDGKKVYDDFVDFLKLKNKEAEEDSVE